MYELIRLSEHDYYIDCPAKMGLVVLDGGAVVAIDSGSDKDAAKKLLRLIEANGWHLQAILNTHSHADHIGGNRFLQEKTGCRVYAPGLEASFTEHPELEAMVLWGGMPHRDLKNKFLLAQPSVCQPLTEAALPEGMTMLPLPGHSFDMTGFRTADGNVFLADCVSSEQTLQKYGIGYLWDPGLYLETLERVKDMEAAHFIPAHAEVTKDIRPLAQKNIDAVQEICGKIQSLLETPKTFEELLQQIFASYGLIMTAQQYALIGSTLRSYLSWLYQQGRIAYAFADNRMLWSTCSV